MVRSSDAIRSPLMTIDVPRFMISRPAGLLSAAARRTCGWATGAARSTDALVFDIVPRLQSSVRQQCVDGREKATFAASLGIYRAGAVEVKLKHNSRQSSVFSRQSEVCSLSR